MNSSATLNAVPKHVAIIMDGNNRWARRASLPGVAGHRAGVESVRRVLEVCNQRGIEALTLFAFSSENWGRPETEVRALMSLLLRYLRKEVDALHRDNVRLRFIGRRDRFSDRLQRLMERSERVTADNTGAQLVLALDYGGRWDIADTARRLAERVASGELDPGQIDETCFDRAISLVIWRRPISASGQGETIVFPTSCFGSLPTLNCILQKCCGQTLARPNWTKHCPIFAPESVASVFAVSLKPCNALFEHWAHDLRFT